MVIKSKTDALLAFMKLTPAETAAFNEARSLLKSPELARLCKSVESCQGGEAQVGRWLVILCLDEPVGYAGMTFGKSAFILFKSAFRSEAELQKTVLQELYRLCTGQRASGVAGYAVKTQTDAAIEYVDRAWPILQWLP